MASPLERTKADIASPFGIATTRFTDRIASSLGKSDTHAPVQFESGEAICGAGLLFLLPALMAQGLFQTHHYYQWPKNAYYSLNSVVLTLAFMILARIKTPEQLKQCKPGELGRLMGLDRIPEVRNIRERINYLSNQNKTSAFNQGLADIWVQPASTMVFCIDGHQQVYKGRKAKLPVKYISREKLCLPASTQYWVNDIKGNPLFVTLGELSENLQTIIEQDVVPRLNKIKHLSAPLSCRIQPRCTLVFDREAYEPGFFNRLWHKHQIAVITYRKNVKDVWPEDLFDFADIQVIEQSISTLIHERPIELGGVLLREVRRLNQDGHQTAIITNNFTLSTEEIAGYMFSRWSEENFFRYMKQDYDIDHIFQYGIEQIEGKKKIINKAYSRLSTKLKKLREKIARLEAKLYPLVDAVIDEPIEKAVILTAKQANIREQIVLMRQQERNLIAERKLQPTHVTVDSAIPDKRLNKLKTESKLFLNILKMIAYRAETSVATLFTPYIKEGSQEKRMLVKQIIQSQADLITDK